MSSNIKRLTQEEFNIIRKAIDKIESANVLPNKIFKDFLEVVFYIDYSIDGTGILGYTKFNPVDRNVFISPTIYENLISVDNNNIPNNEIALSTVVHELTHVYQMYTLGFLFGALNLPIIRDLTTEKWAGENTNVAMEYFSMVNDNLRKMFRSSQH